MDEGGEMATNMSRFYSMLRGQMMKAQIQRDAGVLLELVQLLFSVREAWVELSARLAAASPSAATQAVSSAPRSVPEDAGEIQTASWKA